jgi:hypothetical protein
MKKDKKGNLLKDMNIGEVSLVGRGANDGARVSLFKSDESIEELAKQSFNEALSDMELDERLSNLINNFYDFSIAMRRSFSAIIRNPGITTKKTAIRESLNQFMMAMSGLVDGTDIIKGELDLSSDETIELISFFSKNKGDIISYNNQIEGGFDMNELEKLQKKFDDLQKKLDDDAKTAIADIAKFEVISKMDDNTKTYFNSLDEEGQADFLKKDEKEWSKVIEKSKVDDESFVIHGRSIRKSVVGEDVFEVMKAQQVEIDTGKEIAKEEKEKRETAEFTKTAEILYKNLPGEPELKGRVVKAVDSFTKDVKEAALAMLKAGNEAMVKAKLFIAVGSDEVSEDSAEGKLNKMAEAHAKENDVSFAKAYTVVLKTKEGKKLYEESLEK